MVAPLAYAQEPLNEQDKREILLRLKELELERQKNKFLTEYVEFSKEQSAREKELADKQLALKQQELDLANKEIAVWKEKSTTFEEAYKLATKGRSVKCTIAKIFTLGIVRCR